MANEITMASTALERDRLPIELPTITDKAMFEIVDGRLEDMEPMMRIPSELRHSSMAICSTIFPPVDLSGPDDEED